MNKVKEFFINYLDIIKTFSGGASVLFGAFLNIDWTKHWLCDGNVSVGIKTLFCEYAIYWFLFFSIALFIISIVEQVKGGSYAKVKQELNLNRKKLELLDDNLKDILIGQLIAFGRNELKFGNENLNKERLTLYWVDPEETETKWLYQLARFSSDPTYEKSKSKKYSINKGCIGQAYRHDWCFDPNVTDGVSKTKYNYSDEELSLINMKSHTYAACKIKDSENKIYGVLVAEHIDKNAWEEEIIKSKLQLQSERLAKMLKILNVYIKNRYKDNNEGGTQW